MPKENLNKTNDSCAIGIEARKVINYIKQHFFDSNGFKIGDKAALELWAKRTHEHKVFEKMPDYINNIK